VLDKKTLVRVTDADNVVFADHHDGESIRVGLMSTGDSLTVSVNTILEGTFFAFIVNDGPSHRDFVKAGSLSIRVEYLSISVSELSDDGSFFGTNSSNLTFVVLCLANKILSSLADLAISKVLDKETVRESNGS
jgi:hypothetical protein